jgi:hypothetical protein
MSLIPIFTGGGGFLATGGTITTSGGYKYHTFTSDGNFTVLKGTTTIEYVAVGGGGSGGASDNGFTGNGQYTASGGGGGGQVVYGSRLSANIQISIGAGGNSSGTANGGETSLLVVPTGPFSPFPLANAYGGGYGATGQADAVVGTSGGGGSVKFDGTTQTTYAAANGTSGQGFAGGSADTGIPAGGGGGGAGGAASGAAEGAPITTYSTWNAAAAYIGGGAPGGRAFNDPFITGYGFGGRGSYSADNALGSPGNGSQGVVVIRYAI